MNISNRKTVLFVEDEIALNRIVSRRLEREFSVIPALNGREALKKLESNRVDCILLDLEMPCMNGIEFLRLIRDKGDNTPVLIVTGKSCREYAEEAADLNIQGSPTTPTRSLKGCAILRAVREGLKTQQAGCSTTITPG